MAIWQFECMIIPNNRKKMDYVDIDKYISWNGLKIPKDSFEFLSKQLPMEEGWTKDIRQYGNIDSTCIEIYMTENDVDEIRIRFDLRNISMSLLENIVTFINNINGAIYLNGNTIEVNMQSIIELIKDSDATIFCNDPLDFLKKLDSAN